MNAYNKVLCYLSLLFYSINCFASSSKPPTENSSQENQIKNISSPTEQTSDQTATTDQDQDQEQDQEQEEINSIENFQARVENFSSRVADCPAKAEILSYLQNFHHQFESDLTNLNKPYFVTMLIHGPKGSGKTFLADETKTVLKKYGLIADAVSLMGFSPTACILKFDEVLKQNSSIIVENFDNFLLLVEGLNAKDSTAFSVERSIVDTMEAQNDICIQNGNIKLFIATVDNIKNVPQEILEQFSHIIEHKNPSTRTEKENLIKNMISHYNIKLDEDLSYKTIYKRTNGMTPKRIRDLFKKAEQFAIESDEESISRRIFEKAFNYMLRAKSDSTTFSYYS